jgi:hypothetical protein
VPRAGKLRRRGDHELHRPRQDELQNTLGPIIGVGVLVILVVFKPGD